MTWSYKNQAFNVTYARNAYSVFIPTSNFNFLQGHEASSKEASAKEVEARLNAMKQHNELQQELLQHVLQYHDSFSSIENLAAAASAGTDSELSGSELRDRLKGSLV